MSKKQPINNIIKDFVKKFNKANENFIKNNPEKEIKFVISDDYLEIIKKETKGNKNGN